MEQIQPGTVALLRALRARQRADKLMLGAGYPETGLVLAGRPGETCTPRAVLRSVPQTVPRGWTTAHPPPPDPPHAGRGYEPCGSGTGGPVSLLGHTVDVYVSTYLRPSETGARSAASALGTALAGGI